MDDSKVTPLQLTTEYERRMRGAMAELLCDLIDNPEVAPSTIRRVAEFTAEMIDIYKEEN